MPPGSVSGILTGMESGRLGVVWRRHGVAVAYLFGSRAEGTARAASDHDVAVLFERAPTVLRVGALQADLVTALGTSVDLVDLEQAPLELRGTVVQRGRLIHSSDEPRRVAFEGDTRSRWFDYRPTIQMLTRAYLRRLAAGAP